MFVHNFDQPLNCLTPCGGGLEYDDHWIISQSIERVYQSRVYEHVKNRPPQRNYVRACMRGAYY